MPIPVVKNTDGSQAHPKRFLMSPSMRFWLDTFLIIMLLLGAVQLVEVGTWLWKHIHVDVEMP